MQFEQDFKPHMNVALTAFEQMEFHVILAVHTCKV